MNKLIAKANRFLFSQQKNIYASALVVFLMIFISRVFGFLRYRIFASYFSKQELDIFFASFRIPDLIFELLITGAITSSLIPIYLKYKNNQKELDEIISSITNLVLLFLLFFLLICFISAPLVISIITPGFNPSEIKETIFFTRLFLIGQLPFLIVGNILISIAQANKFFLLTTLAPIIYNIVIIIFTVLFAYQYHLLTPVLGTIIGSFLFLFSQIWIIFTVKFDYQLIIKKSQGLVEFIKTSIPRVFSIIASQIDATVDLSLSTLLGGGSYTIFYFAQHLQLLPVSLIGVALGQASLPYLSEVYHQNKIEEFRTLIVQSLINIIYLTLPIATFFIFARTPLVRLFFGGQKFDWQATVETATTLSVFALSIPFHSCYYLIVRSFYAYLDTKTPFLVSILGILQNTLVSIFLVISLKMPIWSLAFSFSLSIIIQVFILLYFLNKKVNIFSFPNIIIDLTKILVINLFSAVIAFIFLKILDQLIFDTTRTINVFFLLAITGLMFFGMYLLFSFIFGVKQINLLLKLINKLNEMKKQIVESYNTYE